jgi:hypothetical protein
LLPLDSPAIPQAATPAPTLHPSTVWHAAAQLLEGVAALLVAAPGTIPEEARDRIRQSMQSIGAHLGPDQPPSAS